MVYNIVFNRCQATVQTINLFGPYNLMRVGTFTLPLYYIVSILVLFVASRKGDSETSGNLLEATQQFSNKAGICAQSGFPSMLEFTSL